MNPLRSIIAGNVTDILSDGNSAARKRKERKRDPGKETQ